MGFYGRIIFLDSANNGASDSQEAIFLAHNKAVFEAMPVPKALATLAIPSIISQLIALAYNIADTYFIGRTNDPYKIAAVSLLYVLVAIMGGLSNLFGVGGGSLISRLLGARKDDEAKKACAFSFYGSIATALIYSIGCLIFMDPLLRWMGASENTLGYASSYAFYVIVLGGLPAILSMSMAHLLRSEGYAKQASLGLGMGGILNILLDPLFIFALDLGVQTDGMLLTTEEEVPVTPTWTEVALEAMGQNGIVLSAEDYLTRGEMAQILYRVSQLAKEAPGMLVLEKQQ